MLLNSVVLGGIEAGYQPSCRPWDAAAVYIAAAAGRIVGRAKTGKFFTHPHQVQALLISALLKGQEVPSLIAARHELAAHRLLTHLRETGSA
jgi:fructose-1,6-bisphosphatase/inositol monophosphatase family enzyme